MLTDPCTIEKQWIAVIAAVVGAVLGSSLTFFYGWITRRHERRDHIRNKSAALCRRGIDIFNGLRGLHVAWKLADEDGAEAASGFWRTHRYLVNPPAMSDFTRLCGEDCPFTHEVSTSLLTLATALNRISNKHESVRDLLAANAQATNERTQYGNAFEVVMKALASSLVLLSELAPADTKRAVTGNSAIGGYRGNA